MGDDFESGTHSACGGTTTLVPLAAQMKGQSVPDAVFDYHGRARGNAYSRLRLTDPTLQVAEGEATHRTIALD